MKMFIQTIRALANPKLADHEICHEVTEKALANPNLRQITEYLDNEGYISQEEPTIYVMADPKSGFRSFSLKRNYINLETQTTVELIFNTDTSNRDNTYGSLSKHGKFQSVVSIDKTGRIKFTSGNPIANASGALTQWIGKTLRLK